jgi:hypothetical protein
MRSAVRRGGTRQLDELMGKRAAQLLTKARILLKADVSDLGEGRSDSRIAAALDTSIATIERTRRQLVEEGFEAVCSQTFLAGIWKRFQMPDCSLAERAGRCGIEVPSNRRRGDRKLPSRPAASVAEHYFRLMSSNRRAI